jgi:hypothetical protein
MRRGGHCVACNRLLSAQFDALIAAVHNEGVLHQLGDDSLQRLLLHIDGADNREAVRRCARGRERGGKALQQQQQQSSSSNVTKTTP